LIVDLQAERVALNSFELTDLKSCTSSHSQPLSTDFSPRITFDDEDVKENENLSSHYNKDVSNASVSPPFKPSYVSVGTTTGMSDSPSLKEKTIRPPSKTKLSSKNSSNRSVRTKTSQIERQERILKDTKVSSKSVKSVSSNSLVRIPGARPFLKS